MKRHLVFFSTGLGVTGFTVLVLACHDTTQPSTPEAGRYQLATVNGRALPVPLMPNGCPASITGGTFAFDSVGRFNGHIDWSGSCPPTPPSPGIWDCGGVMPATLAPTMDLTGLNSYRGLCTVRVTGYPQRLDVGWTGVDSAVWGDPRFTFTR